MQDCKRFTSQMSHSTTQSTDDLKSDITDDSLIIWNGKKKIDLDDKDK